MGGETDQGPLRPADKGRMVKITPVQVLGVQDIVRLIHREAH